MNPEALAAALEQSALGAWARGSRVGYPIANLAHLLGLAMLAAGIGVTDLRLMGVFRRLPVAALASALLPVAAAGLALMILSGIVMFAADAGPLIGSALFQWKLAVIALALINVAAFHLTWRRGPGGWDAGVPAAARVIAGLSLALWLSAAALGRLIAYA